MKAKTFPSLRNNQGSLMLMAMVGLAVCGILAMVASQAGGSYIIEAKKIKAAHQKLDVERAIKAKTNCARTKAVLMTTSVSNATLVDSRGSRIDGGSGQGDSSCGSIITGDSENPIADLNVLAASNEDLGSGQQVPVLEDHPMVCS